MKSWTALGLLGALLVPLLGACSEGGDKAGAAAPSACVESPQPQPGVRAPVTVTVDLTYAGKPVVFGEPLPLASGGTLTVGDFRFYVSDFALPRAAGEPVPVDVLGADGRPVAYNVQLVSADSAAGLTFRLAAPAGDYTGLSFLFGINDACNHSRPEASRPPLTASSQLAWPQPLGYLFLRYEGELAGAAAMGAPPEAIAMGGLPGMVFAPRVVVRGGLHVGDAGGALAMHVALDEIFQAVAMPADPPNPMLPPGEEMVAGEHVRQNVGKVRVFTFTSGP